MPIVGQMIEIERFDGSRAHVINSASPVRDAAGHVVGSAVAIQDITELRRSQDDPAVSTGRSRRSATAIRP